MTGETETLSRESRARLLKLARGTLEARFRGEPAPRLESDRAETFGQPRGLFVTLRKDGRLRGCIGTLSPDGDLSRSVPRFALQAAFADPRFPELTSEELPGCTIEISVLTAPEPVENAQDIVVGRDGLILESGGRRGLLLPQVAVEWGLDRIAFLAELCRKAGLPPDAWSSPGARIWSFRAEVFAEGEEGT